MHIIILSIANILGTNAKNKKAGSARTLIKVINKAVSLSLEKKLKRN